MVKLPIDSGASEATTQVRWEREQERRLTGRACVCVCCIVTLLVHTPRGVVDVTSGVLFKIAPSLLPKLFFCNRLSDLIPHDHLGQGSPRPSSRRTQQSSHSNEAAIFMCILNIFCHKFTFGNFRRLPSAVFFVPAEIRRNRFPPPQTPSAKDGEIHRLSMKSILGFPLLLTLLM